MPVCKAEAHRALELLEDYYRFVFFFTSIVILCLCVLHRLVFVLVGISCTVSVCLLSVCLYQISVSVFASKCLSLFLYLFGHMGVFLYTYMSSVPCQISFSATQKKFFVKRNKSDNLRLYQLSYSGFWKFLLF